MWGISLFQTNALFGLVSDKWSLLDDPCNSWVLIPLKKLTYPTLGKGTTSSKVPAGRGYMLVPWRVGFPLNMYIYIYIIIFFDTQHGNIYIPRTPTTSIFKGQPPQNKNLNSTQNKGPHLGFERYIYPTPSQPRWFVVCEHLEIGGEDWAVSGEGGETAFRERCFGVGYVGWHC